jgi:hypothetical protein
MATTTTTRSAKKAERLAAEARMNAAKQEAQRAAATNTCPQCGNAVYQNLALAGWVQCHGFPAASHRRPGHENDAKCNWQGFTH